MFVARAQAGYRDNLLLSSSSPESDAFIGGGLEAMAWRRWGEVTRFEAFGTAEHRQYLSSAEVENEQTALALVQLEHEWTTDWSSGEGFEYAYQNQVVDVSATEALPAPQQIEGHTLTGRLAASRRAGPGRLELQLPVTRQLYAESLDDFWELSPGLSYTYPVGQRTELTLGYEFAYDTYDSDPLLTVTGEPIPGTRREMLRHDWALTSRYSWGRERAWRLTLRLGGRWNEDTGSGYYEYWRGLGGLSLRYRPRNWEFEAGLRCQHYRYDQQLANPPDDERRRWTRILTDLRGQRRIWRALAGFVDYAFEQTLANRAVEEYNVHTIRGGIEWEF